MKKELITIIIPFYKIENQIEKCINSVLAQSYRNIEIICIGVKDDIKSIEVEGADPDDIEYFEDSFKKCLIDITK